MAVELDVGHALLLRPDSRSGTGKAGTSAPGRLRRAYAGEGETITERAGRTVRILFADNLLDLPGRRIVFLDVHAPDAGFVESVRRR
jgi:hypothetical protein